MKTNFFKGYLPDANGAIHWKEGSLEIIKETPRLEMWYIVDEYGHKSPVVSESVCICSMMKDANDNYIFSDDLLMDEAKRIFRLFYVPGGFAIRECYHEEDLSELKEGEELKYLTQKDVQLIKENCRVIGNIKD